MRFDIWKVHPTRALIFPMAAVSVLAILSGSATAQPPTPGWTEPRLPGAVTVAPDWLKDAPFDLAKFFAMPPDAENAAPLYLDAFFEFGGEVAECFPPDQRGRSVVAKARYDRLMAIWQDWDKDPKSVPAERIDGLLADFEVGFRKLDLAMARPRCTFAIGMTLDSLVPHAQVARNVVRALRLRVGRSLDKGDFGRAIEDIARMLRISRDVRPRGPIICQIVGIAIDSSACNKAIAGFLAHPRLKVEHCDGLLKVLGEHEAQALDPFATGIQGEYLLLRSSLRSFAQGIKTTLDAEGRPVETKLDRTGTARMMAEYRHDLARNQDPPQAVDPKELDDPANLERTATQIDQFGREVAKDRRWADELTRSLLGAKSSYPARLKVFESQVARVRLASPTLFGLVCPDYHFLIISCSRDVVYLGTARCLIAVRRWQLTHNDASPKNLAEACRAAKMPGVPIDPFSGSPLKLAVIAGEPVVYSVGEDGRDDKALKDADMGRKPGTAGDYLFRIEKRK